MLAAAAAPNPLTCAIQMGSGVGLAAIAWLGFIGIRRALRQRRQGAVRSGNLTGALSVVGVIVAIGLLSVGVNAIT